MHAGTPVLTSTAPALVEVGGGAAEVSSLEPAALAGALARVVGDEPLRDRLRHGRAVERRPRSPGTRAARDALVRVRRGCRRSVRRPVRGA